MRAARYYSPGDVRVEDVPEPKVGARQVKLRVTRNGICGSDLHEYYGQPMMVPTSAPHALTGVQAPVILGHECGGVVVDVGDGVEGITVGTLVAVEPIKRCAVCAQCIGGRYNLCSNMAFHGFSTGGGGLAEFTVVDQNMTHQLPQGFTAEQSALIEPLAVSYHAVRRSAVQRGQIVAVHGAGPIGLGAVLALRHLGVDVIVSDPAPERRAIVESITDAKAVLDPASDDVVAAILDMTSGRGADATIDAAGVPSVMDAALFTTAKEGKIVLVAIPQQPLQLHAALLFMTEVDLRASTAYRGDFPLVIAAMAAGAYPTDGWITTIGLDDVISRGFEVLRGGNAMKILVDPSR